MKLSKALSFLIILFSFSQLRAQETVEKVIADEYIPSYCACLEENREASAEQLLTTVSLKCGLQFAMKNFKQLQEVIDEKFPDMTQDEQYEAGRLLGGDIKIKAAARIVKECEVHRKALIEFNKELSANTSKPDIKKEITRLNQQLTSGSKRSKAETYLTIGSLLEKAGDDKGAMEAYEKSDKVKPSAIARGFKVLLEMKAR